MDIFGVPSPSSLRGACNWQNKRARQKSLGLGRAALPWPRLQGGYEYVVGLAGVSHEALEYADQAVIIPQAPGFVDSFNVSVATALALYEARTSRIR